MTYESFSQYLAETTPATISASHYDLARAANPANIYGLDDGYAFAGSRARKHLPEGGEWPYYIAATPSTSPADWDDYTAASPRAARAADATQPANPNNAPEWDGENLHAAIRAGRVLETYCEGDLVAYIFDSEDERDTAAERWQETEVEHVARLIEESGEVYPGAPLAPAEDFAEAVAEILSEGREEIDADNVARAVDLWTGRQGSVQDYAEEDAAEAYNIPDQLLSYIDWEKFSRDYYEGEHTERNGYVFRDC